MMTIQGLSQGVMASIVIPFTTVGSVDWDGLEREVRFLEDTGIAGFCVGGLLSGTAGAEIKEIASICRTVRGLTRKPLFAMIYPDVEVEALNMGRAVLESGADAILVAQPHYLCQPNEAGICGMFATLRKELNCPLILADCFPDASVELKSIEQLVRMQLVDGVFEAASAHTLVDLLLLRLEVPVYCGIEDLHYVFLMLGVDGILSDLSAAFPKEVSELYQSYLSSDYEEARQRQERLVRIWNVLNHPSERQGRLRSVLFAHGRDVGMPRSPYSALSLEARTEVGKILEQEGLLQVT